jgi:hypothetical protein
MSLIIHICNNDRDADDLIVFLKRDPDFSGTNIRKLEEPDIIINDNTANIAIPDQINIEKVCVLYEE